MLTILNPYDLSFNTTLYSLPCDLLCFNCFCYIGCTSQLAARMNEDNISLSPSANADTQLSRASSF